MSRFMEQRSAAWVSTHVSGARQVLRSYGIDPTSRMSLDVAAAAASVTPDALLAETAYREQMQVRKLRRAELEHDLEYSL